VVRFLCAKKVTCCGCQYLILLSILALLFGSGALNGRGLEK